MGSTWPELRDLAVELVRLADCPLSLSIRAASTLKVRDPQRDDIRPGVGGKHLRSSGMGIKLIILESETGRVTMDSRKPISSLRRC